jgi:hypothetical protein
LRELGADPEIDPLAESIADTPAAVPAPALLGRLTALRADDLRDSMADASVQDRVALSLWVARRGLPVRVATDVAVHALMW